MNPLKIYVLYRKDKPEDAEKVEAIKKVATTAAQQINKQVQVEPTTNFAQFQGLSVNFALTPIVVINNISEFGGMVPTVDQMKQRLLRTGGAAEIF